MLLSLISFMRYVTVLKGGGGVEKNQLQMYVCEVNLIIYQYIFCIRFGYKRMDIVLNSSVIELGILGAILISLSLLF